MQKIGLQGLLRTCNEYWENSGDNKTFSVIHFISVTLFFRTSIVNAIPKNPL